jgi:predicted aspartyl protease
MKTAPLLLLAGLKIFGTQETVVPAGRIGDVLILNQVYINSQGPLRMMIDTGASTSVVRRDVAVRLGLPPVYAVELSVTGGAKTLAPAALVEVRIGPLLDNAVEAVIMDLPVSGIDGVLGQSWLVRHDYLLDYRHRRLVVDLLDPPAGVQTALRSTDGRPQISAEVNGRRQDLVVDSGASVLVLFGQRPTITPARLTTNLGAVDAGIGTAAVRIGGSFTRRLKAAQVDAPPQPGLLPAATFQSVYVSNRNGVVVFVP